MQRFIVCTDSAKGLPLGATPAERNGITMLFDKLGWQTWHWFEDVWLLVNPHVAVTPAQLREWLTAVLSPSMRHFMIIEVTGEMKFSGIGDRKGWPWMTQYWGRPE